jgi:hypothetical protein
LGCEVENRFVLDLLLATLGTPLPERNYKVVDADTDDAPGIDVAFIYDADLFEVPAGEVFFHVVMRRNATRELVQVNFQTQKSRTWSVFGTTGRPAARVLESQRINEIEGVPLRGRGFLLLSCNAKALPRAQPHKPATPHRLSHSAGDWLPPHYPALLRHPN